MEFLARMYYALGSDGMVCVTVAIVTAVIALVATPAVRLLALHLNATDNPGGRHVHTEVTARLGGIAVLIAIVGGAIFGILLWPCTGEEQATTISVVLPILLIGCVVCLFGALDDLYPLTPSAKLFGLVGASLMLIVCGVSIEYVEIPGLGRIGLGLFAIPVTIIWVLACTNALNLIDGVDGAGSGVVMISASSMMLLALGLGDFTTGLLFGVTAGAAGGFLFHNRQPATIFLGDSGSLLLGFMLAATSAAGCTKNSTAILLLGAVFALAVPFLDATQAFVRRFRSYLRRTNRFHILSALRATGVADLGHIHHRLLFRGLSHRQVAQTICLVTLITSLTALLLLPTGQVHWVAWIGTLSIGSVALVKLGSLDRQNKPEKQDKPATSPVGNAHGPQSAPTGGPQGMGPTPQRDSRHPRRESTTLEDH